MLLALWRTNQKITFLFLLTFIWGKNNYEKRLAVKMSNEWLQMLFQLFVQSCVNLTQTNTKGWGGGTKLMEKLNTLYLSVNLGFCGVVYGLDQVWSSHFV